MAAWDEAELKSAVRLVGPDRAVAVFFEADTPLSLWRRFVAVPGHATIVLRASGLRLYALLAASTQDATFDQALPKLLQLIMLCDPSGECVLRGDGLGMPRAEVFRHASHRRLRRFLDLPELRRLRLKHPAINALAAAALLCLRGRCLSTRSDEPDNKQQRCFGHYLRSLKANLDLVSRIPDTELLPEELDLILNAPARGRCSSPCVSATTPPSSPCALSRSSSPSRSAVRARIVSEETLGISGGLCIAENLQTQYAERRGGGASNPGEGGDWYFAPAGLRGLTALEGRLARPLQVSVEPSDEHGFLLAVSGLDWRHPGWHAAQHSVSRASLGSLGLPELATDLEQHSTLGTAGIGLGSLLARLPRKRPTSKHATFQWAPASAEAIVRFSALLAAGQTLRLDPGERYPQRAIVSVALRLPDDQPSELDVRLIRTAPVLTSGLWAELGDAVPTPPWSGVFDRMDAHIS
jgi:hypothetical protein